MAPPPNNNLRILAIDDDHPTPYLLRCSTAHAEAFMQAVERVPIEDSRAVGLNGPHDEALLRIKGQEGFTFISPFIYPRDHVLKVHQVRLDNGDEVDTNQQNDINSLIMSLNGMRYVLDEFARYVLAGERLAFVQHLLSESVRPIPVRGDNEALWVARRSATLRNVPTGLEDPESPSLFGMVKKLFGFGLEGKRFPSPPQLMDIERQAGAGGIGT